MRKQRIVLCGIAALSLTPYAAAADENAKPAETEKEAAKTASKKATDKTVQLEAIKIIADSPVGDSGVEEYKLPSHVQTVDAEQLDQAESVTLPDYMNRFLGSVNVNDAQNNPFQPDVQYRGFVASPLLGLPQGLSIYVNGIRFNEPFGDTVNWDLIPEGAIDKMSLESGSNPVFGQNTLGGAISIRTKTGFTAPGYRAELFGGSWGRNSEEVETGWNDGEFGAYFHFRNFHEDGWREYSPTGVMQWFSTLSWKNDERSNLNLNFAATDDNMIGNGAVPIQLYNQQPNAVFTYPDQTKTNLFLASLDGNHWLTDEIELSGNAFFRQNLISTYNGDGSDYEPCENDPSYMCDDGGEGGQVYDVNGNPVVSGPKVEGATNNFTQTNQRNYGGSLQSAFNQKLGDYGNRFLLGGVYNQGQVDYGADTELAELLYNRGTEGSGVILEEPRVRLHTNVYNYGVYLSDSFSLTDQLTFTASGRYNLTQVQLMDQIGTSLNGNHSYDRINPSAGLTYNWRPELNFFGNFSQSNRAPTPVELSCADPAQPCKLPNAFISDPSLKQVVATTGEIGARGGFNDMEFADMFEGDINWNATLFQTENSNDILFIASGGVYNNQGYFDNVGQTLRQGFELGVNAEFERVRLGLNYTLLDATFQTPFVENSPNNPDSKNGLIYVQKGDHIPGIPQNMLKFNASVTLMEGLTAGTEVIYNSGQYLRGDEANLTAPLQDYAIVMLHGEYRYDEHFSMFFRVNNLFDVRYQTFGMYGNPREVLGPEYTDNRFIGAGSPRAAWAGIKLAL
ncbi:MAG: TonB-dependent receptor [Methylococcus sp.]|nr:TonB-dependent receptor [Methylococcus sp.]